MPSIPPIPTQEETPVYVIRSSKPQGPRGRIYFELLENGLEGIGELDKSSYDTSEYRLSKVALSSEDYNYGRLGEDILQGLNERIRFFDDGVKDLGVLSIVKTQGEPSRDLIEYTIKGKIIDIDNQPLGGALISDNVKKTGLKGSNTNSEPNGEFLLKGEYKKNTKFKIRIKKEDYTQYETTPFTLDGFVKYNLGPIKLTSIKAEIQKSLKQGIPMTDSQMIELKIPKVNLEMAQQQFMNGIINTVKTTLLPSVLVMIAEFGVSKAQDAIDKSFEEMGATCPTDLNLLIERKNKLTKQLNNLYNSLNRIKVGVETVDKIITISQIVAGVLSGLVTAFPSIPFSPDPTKILTTPIPDPTGKMDSVLDRISKTLGKFKLVSSSTLIVLTVLISLLQMILNYLSLLDNLIQNCATETSLPQEQISEDLLLSTQQQSQQLSPVVINVNGFEMGVIPVDNSTVGGLKRRKAIARNSQGIIMLQGEPSFSSNDQILIDELVFYIKQNDLKA